MKIRRKGTSRNPIQIQVHDDDVSVPPSVEDQIEIVNGKPVFKDSLPDVSETSGQIITSLLDFGIPWKRSNLPFVPPKIEGQLLEEYLEGVTGEARDRILYPILGLEPKDLIPYPSLDPFDPNFNKIFNPELYLTDFRYFCESFLQIDSKSKSIIPFKLNPVQLSFLTKRTGRDVILKARQHGFTTLMIAYYLWDTMNNHATTTIILAHEKEPAKRFLNKVRMMYESLPVDWRPPLSKNADDHIIFEGLESEIIIQAIKDTAGRSITCNNLLLSEFGFYGDQVEEDTLIGLTESVPEANEATGDPGGSITIESTPNGVGNLFYKECQDAENGESANKLFNIPWYFNPEYDEAWRDRKKKSLKTHTERGSRAWGQEYCSSFLQSQRSFFSQETCIPNSPYQIWLKGDPNGNPYPGWVQVYREPMPGKFYVIGADVSQGLEHGDFSDATLLSRLARIEEAHIHGKMKPEAYAECLYWLGKKFNWALLAVEAQQSGHTVLYRLLHDLEYPNLFYHPNENHLVQNIAPPIGWQTTRKTRPIMLEEFRAAREEEAIFLAFKKRKTEMEVFTYDSTGKPVAPKNFNDDTIISGSIAHRLLDYPDMMAADDEVMFSISSYGG